ncbi:sugar phosphate nucleotidyltransferase [Rhodobacteraceae bacterium nBUS_24]
MYFIDNLQEFSLTVSCSIKDALKIIDKNAEGFCLVFENEDFLYLLTDGDLRRHLIAGGDLTDGVKLLQKDTQTVDLSINYEELKLHFRTHTIDHLPVISESGIKFVAVNKNQKHYISAIVMAGGLGSRLGNLTKNTPKPLLKIGGQRLIDYALNILTKSNIYDIDVTINHMKEVFIKFFQNHRLIKKKNLLLEEKKLGTAGGIKLSKMDAKFRCVINADLITDVDINEGIFNLYKSDSDFLIYTREISQKLPFGEIIKKGMFAESVVEKPERNHEIAAGIYVYKSELEQFIPNGRFFDMPDFINLIIAHKKKVLTERIQGYWIDVGVKSNFDEAVSDMRKNEKKSGD